jgi:hypothetical protein
MGRGRIASFMALRRASWSRDRLYLNDALEALAIVDTFRTAAYTA